MAVLNSSQFIGRARSTAKSRSHTSRLVREQVPSRISSALLPLLEEIENLTVRIHEYDKQIEELATTKYPRTELMRQIRGVGVVTILAFALTIDDPNRFSSESRSKELLWLAAEVG